MRFSIDLVKLIEAQRKFSSKAFGPGDLTAEICAHLREELGEIETAGSNELLGEWVDVVLIALDACWRVGHEPEEVAEAIYLKQCKNRDRKWPDWRKRKPGEAIHHIEEGGDVDDADGRGTRS